MGAGNPDAPHPIEGETYWALDLLRGNHPTFREDDFTIVEDTISGKIVSVTNLIDQVWSYGGIPLAWAGQSRSARCRNTAVVG